jgi:hypothetical protein
MVRESMMSAAAPDRAARSASELWTSRTTLFWAGIFLWLIAMLLTWPVALSFGDEVGYLGQARLLLEGRVRPVPGVPGVWATTPAGLIPKYPLFFPLLIAPAFAISPRAVFALGVAAAIALAWIASRVLRSWNRDPLWGLLLLAHPTIVILSKTLMTDVLMTLFVVAAWWSFKRGSRPLTIALFAATVAIKPTGVVIGGALIAGEALSLYLAEKPSTRRFIQRLSPAVIGLLLGGMVAAALNLLAHGGLWYGYREGDGGRTFFSPTFLPTSGKTHLKSLLLCPPLLLIGVWPYWRRRDWGPLFVIAGLTLMMSVYFFVDWGRGWLESLILSQRLILPAVGFLLIGYAGCLAYAASHPLLRRLATVVLMIVPMATAFVIGSKHRRWQDPMAAALATAAEVSGRRGDGQLGFTPSASKIGLLHDGPTAMVGVGGAATPAVVLCAGEDYSYRLGNFKQPCRVDGYRSAQSLPGYEILLREERGRSR